MGRDGRGRKVCSIMQWILRVLVVVCVWLVGLVGQVAGASAQAPSPQMDQPVDPVIQWNRVLLTIVRTAGAQPATIHPTRGFAIMHAAIFDAVNAIDRGHRVY